MKKATADADLSKSAFSLEEFIKTRLQELAAKETELLNTRHYCEDELAKIGNRLAQIDTERDQLARAARAVDISEFASRPEEPPKPTVHRFRRFRKRTIRDAVFEVLRDRGPMRATEIRRAINHKFKTSYPTTSVSSQLSRLKAAEKVTQHGALWNLAGAEETSPVVLPEAGFLSQNARMPSNENCETDTTKDIDNGSS